MNENKLVEFCYSVKNGFGTIVDSIVSVEYQRIYEEKLDTDSLASLLALLEKHDLLDKKNGVNKDKTFYQEMYKNITKK